MASHARRQLRDLHKDLYERAYKEAYALVEGTSKSILQYSQKFEASLPKTFERCDEKTLQSAISGARYLLFGDFHTLKQTQKGLIRVLRELSGKRPIVLAMETFKAKDQKLLDRYLNGEMEESAFLEASAYERDWGFPWQNYQMVLDFANERGIPVQGINTDHAGRDPLKKRDQFAAEMLERIGKQNPDALIVCLIGEYHLADDHLPAALAARAVKGKSVRILTNVDKYFFQMHPEASNIHEEEYLHLKDDLCCIMNSPPWMKWQSYAIWEELRSATHQIEEGSGEEEGFTEEAYDVDYQFLHMVKTLTRFLKIDLADKDLTRFHVMMANSADEFMSELVASGYSKAEAERIAERAANDGVYYNAIGHSVMLHTVSLNNMAEASGQYLHHIITKTSESGENDEELFYRRVLKAMVGFLASKILNPRRKCMDFERHREFLAEHEGKRLMGQAQVRRDIARAVLKHHDWMLARLNKGGGRFPQTLAKEDRLTSYEISRAIGQALGMTLYMKIMSNGAPSDLIPQIFQERLWNQDLLWQRIASIYSLLKEG